MKEAGYETRVVGFDCAEEVHEAVLLGEHGEEELRLQVDNEREKVEEARRTLEKAVTEAASLDPWLRDHPPIVQWHGYQFDSASISTDEPILQTVFKAFSDATGTEAELEGMTYASDARLLIDVGGTPTIVFGPGDVRDAHSANESVSLEDLDRTVRTLALTILRFLGYHD